MNIQNLVLDINKKCNQIVTANVGEVGSRFLKINIIDNGMPVDLTGITVYLYAKKADDTKVFNTVKVEDAKQGIVSAEITSQVLAIEGFVKLTLLLVKDNARLATKIFNLKVDETIIDDEAIESANEFGALTESLSKLGEWNSYFEETSGKIEEKYTERLNQVDSQLEHIANKGTTVEVIERVTKEEIDKQIADGTIANLTIEDGSITREKLSDGALALEFSTNNEGENLFIKEQCIEEYGYYKWSTGEFISSNEFRSTNFISCLNATILTSNSVGNIAFWDENKKYISGTDKGKVDMDVSIPVGAYYFTHSMQASFIDSFSVKLNRHTVIRISSNYEINGELINDKSLPISKIESDTIGLVTEFEYQEPGVNLFNKEDIERNVYYDEHGIKVSSTLHSSTNFIKVKTDTIYTKFNFGGKVTFWDDRKKFISGEDIPGKYFTTPSTCSYIRLSIENRNIDRAMLVKDKQINIDYVPYQEGYLKSDLLNIEPINLSDNTFKTLSDIIIDILPNVKFRINPDKPLDIKTYDEGGDQPTHPKVLYFKNGWNGHKYWMAYTPFPYNNSFEENPCITYSDDGVNWSEEGISNPITRSEVGGCYFSDTHLVYREDINTMELWVRYCSNGNDGNANGWEGIYRLKSTDGINWSEKELLFNVVDTSTTSLISPTVIYDEGKYKIWVVYKSQCLKYYESTDGTNWVFVREIEINPKNDPYKIWHFDIIKTNLGYEFVGCYRYNGVPDRNNFIYYSKSEDNINYDEPIKILKNGYDGSFDSLELYRPSLVKHNESTDNEYYSMYYGAQGKIRNWRIGLVRFDDLSIARFI